jgi:hypothetical protein
MFDPQNRQPNYNFSSCPGSSRFLVPSVSGNSYILVVYDYDSNFIHAEPMKNRTKEVILAAYQRVISLLKSRGLQPKVQKLDKKPLKSFSSTWWRNTLASKLSRPVYIDAKQQSAQFGHSKTI